MKRIGLLLAMGMLLQSCAPERAIPVINSPEIVPSAVLSVESAIAVQGKIKETTSAQQVNITAVDADITRSLEYAMMIKPYTDADGNGISLHRGLIRSLNSADTHIQQLNLSNEALIGEMFDVDKMLDQLLTYARAKDVESAQWVKVSQNKDQMIANLKSKLDQSIERQSMLRLDLEDAAVYKRAVIALIALIFSYFLFKAIASVWSPFAKFRV